MSGIPITYYEESGNMKSQKDKGILDIKYNFLDLPNYITFDKTFIPRVNLGGGNSFNVNTQYWYRADGAKLKKLYTYGTGTSNRETATVTEYLDGFQYGAASTTGKFTLGLKFVPTAEGYYNFENNQYIYSYTDHLDRQVKRSFYEGYERSSIRLSYFNNGTSAEVLEENNYYPFGLKHEGYNPTAGNNSYQYKYNGVELQQESGMYAMDWRSYMPELGRFSGMDMLSESYDDSTPYHFALNNPVFYSDPTGMYTNIYGGYRFTDTAEIAGLQEYFKGEGSVGGLGDYMKDSGTFALDKSIDEVTIPGKGNKNTWNLGSNYLFNSYAMYNGILKALNNWNFQVKSDAMAESLIGVRNDGPIKYVGGAGDPWGIWEVGGMALAARGGNQNYVLAALLITRSGNTGNLLKILNAEKGMLSAEKAIISETSEKVLAPYYPVDGGAMGKWASTTLQPGSKIDRFGSNYGKYFSDVGTPMEMRALPPGNTGNYTTFEVLKPFTVQTSRIAPAFGQIGTGIQYYSPFLNANELIMGGFIKPIP